MTRWPHLIGIGLALTAPACTEATWEGRNPGECDDAGDNDLDGLFDCDDPDCAGAPACSEPELSFPGGWAFEDRTSFAGLHEEDRDLHGAGGRGIAVGDVNRDGWPDLFLTGRQGSDFFVANRLYLGLGDGRFDEAREDWGLPSGETPGSEVNQGAQVGPSAATFADYDNDGDPDLFLANEGHNQVFRNEGDRFIDVTEQAGIAGGSWLSTGAALADYDNDGWLDLWVTNNLDLQSPGDEGYWNRPPDPLYRNRGDGGFDEVTEIIPVPQTQGAGFAATWADFDDDGDPDLYVANDHGHNLQPNQLYRNDGEVDGTWSFVRVSEDCGCELPIAAMGLALGDYNRDDRLDLYITNLLMDGGEFLLTGDGQLSFVDNSLSAGAVAGLSEIRESSWGSQFLDFDRDGWLDLFVVFGSWQEEQHPSPNLLLKGGALGFEAVEGSGVEERVSESEGAVALDYDLDGCLDLLVQNLDGQPDLHRGLCASSNQWIGFKLEGQTSNRDGVGAVVRLTTSSGLQRRQVTAGSTSVYSSRWTTLHFGLAEGEDLLNAEVSWPSGAVDDLGSPTPGYYFRVVETQGIVEALDR